MKTWIKADPGAYVMIGGTRLGPNAHLLYDPADPAHVAASAEIASGRLPATLVSLPDDVVPVQGTTTKWLQRSS